MGLQYRKNDTISTFPRFTNLTTIFEKNDTAEKIKQKKESDALKKFQDSLCRAG